MKTYPLFKAHVPIDAALQHIKQAFESGYINEGVQVTQLTSALMSRLRADNIVLTNSCTSALTMALLLAGVKAGDEVITTPMTCVATNMPIIGAGAKPVWADVDPIDGMLTADTVASQITERTKAVIVVAWAGIPPELGPLVELCRQRCIKLIIDAAHAFGASYKGNPIHSYADYTCYSFQAIKHFTTGDGGALVCRSSDDHERSKAMKWFGLDRDRAKDSKGDWKGQQWDVDIFAPGFKFNMNNMSAALGLSQLPHIDDIINTHRVNSARYDSIDMGTMPRNERQLSIDGSDGSDWVHTVIVPAGSRLQRDELLAALNHEGIMAGLVHVPNNGYTVFRDYDCELPGVKQFSERQLSLPCGWWLSQDDIDHIAGRVKELLHG